MIAAMVFAAGRGTRMRPLTDDRPKALVPVAGRPLIEHALDQVEGAHPVVVNAHHHAERLIAHLAGRPVIVRHETPTLLETGGGLRAALPLLGAGPVLTMNADAAWTGPTARATLTAAWDGAAMDGLLLLVPKERASGQAGGAFAIGPDGRLSRDADGLIYTGAGIVRTDGLARDPRDVFSLRDLWFDMLARGRLFGVVHPGRWADVGTPDGIAAAEAMLEHA
ncbi:bifunctional N-acetylglucosamine-1-phosphate uridyltransferase/glucosamine-1-phosphate acetyltransferase [Jannaschia seosinensis]|uniref:Bifunctional N-acetylglucosamine-1-phosphate uridyltransferase/glucosamine-1-phosphate acetyltransferase n=1 Tax=Jannaschia seosinensis TaxID=313367 RepID=A0A0M7B7X7_9RHOB|nr:nucleotidyltransferase family protein [Jannaschia seosinensis]CUH38820.1 bifunctional N-acetylglucosamine-1-phosphate uridyltransferase/glucosamine-1-phosphate acetyltransferase [Jannaschia seosinensis]